MATRSGVRIELVAASLPALDGALESARAGVSTAGTRNNRAYADVEIGDVAPELVELAYDPQTAGGLLISLPARPRPGARGRVRAGRAVSGTRRGGGRRRRLSPRLTRVDGVETGAQPLPRVRGTALSLDAFRRLAWVSAGMLVLIVATGATVRLTGSGLGCEHWPGCQQHHFEPKSFHSYIEFGNRVVAFFTILATLLTFVGALWARLSTRLRVLAFAIFFGTLLQAPLGAITIHYHLNPWLVLSHFLLSVVVLTLGVALAVEVSGRPVGARACGSCGREASSSRRRRSC